MPEAIVGIRVPMIDEWDRNGSVKAQVIDCGDFRLSFELGHESASDPGNYFPSVVEEDEERFVKRA